MIPIREVNLSVGPLPTDIKLTVEGEDSISKGGVRYLKLDVQPQEFPTLELGIWSERFVLNGPVSLKLVHLTDPAVGHHLTRNEIGAAYDRAVELSAGKEFAYLPWSAFQNRPNHDFFEEFFYQCLLGMGLKIRRTMGQEDATDGSTL